LSKHIDLLGCLIQFKQTSPLVKMGKESGFNRLCLKVILTGSQSLRLDRERSQGQ